MQSTDEPWKLLIPSWAALISSPSAGAWPGPEQAQDSSAGSFGALVPVIFTGHMQHVILGFFLVPLTSRWFPRALTWPVYSLSFQGIFLGNKQFLIFRVTISTENVLPCQVDLWVICVGSFNLSLFAALKFFQGWGFYCPWIEAGKMDMVQREPLWSLAAGWAVAVHFLCFI